MARASGGSWVIAIFVVFWGVVGLAMDGLLAWQSSQQLIALTYPHAPGTILKSSVEEDLRAGDDAYQIHVEYAYEVDGVPYTGERYRAAQWISYDRSARAIVASLPPGAAVAVYYHPQQPWESLLRPGLDGNDLYFALFLAPLNALIAFGCLYTLEQIGLRARRHVAGGYRVGQQGFSSRVELLTPAPLTAAIFVFGTASLGLIMILALTAGMSPGVSTMQWVWGLLLALTGLSFVVTYRLGETRELVLAEDEQRLMLISSDAATPLLTLAYREVGDVRFDADLVQMLPDPDADEELVPFAPVRIYYRNDRGELAAAELVRSSDRERSCDLVAWIKDQIDWREPAWIGDLAAFRRTLREGDSASG